MRLPLVLSSIVFLAMAANQPCLAKDGHAQHAVRAGATSKGASAKGTSSANPAPSKASAPIDAGETIAPPVLLAHAANQHQVRIVDPSAKIPANASRGQGGAMTSAAPGLRNAIGQSVVPPKYVVGAQSPIPLTLRGPGAVPPPIVHRPATPAVVSSGTARANIANATNRGSVNGATVIRPAIGPPAIGGPVQPRYGINGTTVQNKR